MLLRRFKVKYNSPSFSVGERCDVELVSLQMVYIVIDKYVKMMKTQAITNLRSTSNSTESLKLKKSNSSQFANKMKSSLNQLANPL